MAAQPQNYPSQAEFLEGSDDGDPYVPGNPVNSDTDVQTPESQDANAVSDAQRAADAEDAAVESEEGQQGVDAPDAPPVAPKDVDTSLATPPPVPPVPPLAATDPTAAELAALAAAKPANANDGKPWSKLRQLQETVKGQEAQLKLRDEADARRETELNELRAWRSQQDAAQQARAQLIAEQTHLQQQPQKQLVAGVDRPFTPQERLNFERDYPIEYNAYLALEAQEQTRQLAARQDEFENRMLLQTDIDSFKAVQPDYVDAVKYLEADERAMYTAAGMDEQRVNEMIQFRTAQLVQIARQNGRSVASTAYEMAKARGYARGGAAPTAPTPVAASLTSNGASPQQRVQESQRRNALAGTSLSNITGNGGAKSIITRSQLLAMPESEVWRRDEEDPNWANDVVDD